MPNYQIHIDQDLARNSKNPKSYSISITPVEDSLRKFESRTPVWNNILSYSGVVRNLQEAIDIVLLHVPAAFELLEITDHQDESIKYRVERLGYKLGFGYSAELLARKTKTGVYRRTGY